MVFESIPLSGFIARNQFFGTVEIIIIFYDFKLW